MTKEISVQQFKDAVLEVLAERGDDFTYNPPEFGPRAGQCVYSADHGETGSCLFGVAFIDKLGAEWDYEWESGELALEEILDCYVVPVIDSVTVNTAARAQADQDAGKPYGQIRTYLESKGWTHS